MKEAFDSETHEIVRAGILGIIGAAGGFTISKLEVIEAWMRVASLGVGIIVSLMTLVYIILKIKRLISNSRYQ